MFAFQCVIPIIVAGKRGVKKNGMRGGYLKGILSEIQK